MSISLRETQIKFSSPDLNLLQPLLRNRDSSQRFSTDEKALLATNLREVWKSQELSSVSPFIDFSKNLPQGDYPDGEPFIRQNFTPETIDLIKTRGQLTALANLETLEDLYRFRGVLDLLGNPNTTLASMYFPLERGDRTEQKLNGGTDVVLLKTAIQDMARSGVTRVMRAETHSPASAYWHLEAGMKMVDVTAIPLMFQAAINNGIVVQSDEIIPVTGDDGAKEMGRMIYDLAQEYGIQSSEPIAGVKDKSNGNTRVHYESQDLARIYNHTAVIGEDILATGGTLREVSLQLLAAGAKKVIILVTYPIVANNALGHLKDIEGLTVITTDGRKPMNDISSARNFIQIQVFDRFAKILNIDQQGINLYSEEGQHQLKGLGFMLAPWLLYH